MARIQLKELTKEFEKNVQVIDDINLEIKDGEFLVLVGPSGCGKSTTLRLVAGLEEVTHGEIYIGERRVNQVPPKDRDISMVFQNYALYPHMSVFDNMAFGLKLRKYKKPEIKARVEEAAEILEIEELLERKPKQLSGGQRQRVALGRAIVRKPAVFLFDEPLSNLDAKLRVQMRTEIKKLHQKLQTTMVYVTHDQVEAMTMGDRIAVMKEGIIHQVDTPMQIYAHPEDLFVAGFIGSPAMNFIHATLKQNDTLIADEGKIQVPIPEKDHSKLNDYQGQKIVIGIRPEDIYMEQREGRYPPVKLNLEVFEPMGNETVLYFTTGKTPLVCKSDTFDPEQEISDMVTVYFDMDQVHYFDESSGAVI